MIAPIQPMELPADRADGPIILFDAECVLCSANAKFVLRHDKTGHFRLASIQGKVGAELFRKHDLDPDDPSSILVVDGTSVRQDSDAVLSIYENLGFPWNMFTVLRIVPKNIRDPIYRLIARHRYRLFGKRPNSILGYCDGARGFQRVAR
jgi:predicted DCC family thiol-disulfide oxidoreductase YuxK